MVQIRVWFALAIVARVAVVHAQAIAVTPLSIEFGAIPAPGMSNAMQVTVTNAGTDPITLTAATLGGPDPTAFTVGSAAGVLAPGAMRQVDVTFTPVIPGDASASVTFAATDNAISPRTMFVHATGIPAKLQATPFTLDFGTVNLGADETRTLTLMNVSQDMVQIQSVSANSTDFVAGGVDTAGPIAPNAMTTFGVTFAPAREGASIGTLAVTLVGGNAPEVTIPAMGTGIVKLDSDATAPAAPAGCCNVDGNGRGDAAGAILSLVFIRRMCRRRVAPRDRAGVSR